MRKDLVVWLEGRPEHAMDFINHVTGQGYSINVISTIHQLADILENHSDEVAVIISELMLYGIKSLDPIGIQNVPIPLGYEAIFPILSHYLRPASGEAPYSGIPVIILATLWNFGKKAEYYNEQIARFKRPSWAPIAGVEKTMEKLQEFQILFKSFVN